MQFLFNGLVSGLLIAVLALGFQSVYLPTRIFFFAVAGIYALAPYLAMVWLTVLDSWLLACLLTVGLSAVFSVVLDIINHAPLSRRGAGDGTHLITSLGLYIIIVQSIVMIWGGAVRTFHNTHQAIIWKGIGIVATQSQMISLIICLSIIVLSVFFLHKTKYGRRIRAIADNEREFSSFGYRISFYRIIAFSASGAFSATASMLTANDVGFDPNTGLTALLLSIVAVIVGGHTSFGGAILGGIMLGLLRAFIVSQLSQRWQAAAVFGLLIVVLLLKPQGIFTSSQRLESEK